MQSARDVLLALLVFFAGTLFLGLFSGVIIAILVYLILRYRNRIKELQKKLAGTSGAGPADIPSSSEP